MHISVDDIFNEKEVHSDTENDSTYVINCELSLKLLYETINNGKIWSPML